MFVPFLRDAEREYSNEVCVMREVSNYTFDNGYSNYNQGVSEIGTYGYEANYIAGNTVYVGDILPDAETLRREREEERIRRKKNLARKNARALRRSRRMAFRVVLAAAAFCAFFVGYVNLQTSIRAHMKNIATLKTEISDMKASNSAAESRINTAVDINEIKNTALTEYGMVYANEGQIVYYDICEEDYMSKYQD